MPSPAQPLAIMVTCPRGVAPLTAGEITALGLAVRAVDDSTLATDGSWLDAQRLCLHLRTAQHVHVQVGEARVEHLEDLYRAARILPWEEYLHEDGYFTVRSAVWNPTIRDNRMPALKLKDAVADRMVAKRGRRPDSGPAADRAALFLYWKGNRARFYLDASGEPLSHRGYRQDPWKAPLRETLAAACVLSTPWRGGQPFVNPMCGSGTLAIEAALLGAGRAPGLARDHFGFMHLRGFREKDWKALRAEAAAAARNDLAHPVVASDISPHAIAAARRNASRAGVDHLITWQTCDFRETTIPPPPGVILLNPEYGERLGDETKLEPTYKAIGDFFKQRCQGYMGYVFTGNLALAKKIGLRSKRRIPLFNAQIECRLLEFELYAGTRDP
jgi:putative N6-adenine-specific DNA methylase